MLFAGLGETESNPPPETRTQWPDCERGTSPLVEGRKERWFGGAPAAPGPCPYVVMW